MSRKTYVAVCEGCGVSYEKVDIPRNRRRTKCRPCSLPRGAAHHSYNGGLVQDSDGRWRIIGRDGSRPYYYRAVMEAHLGRPLLPDEDIHHMNHDVTDDRIENLMVLDRRSHGVIHGFQSGAVRRARKAAA